MLHFIENIFIYLHRCGANVVQISYICAKKHSENIKIWLQ